MELSAATWTAVSKLLDEALDLEPAARAAWLQRLIATRPELAPSVRKLLAAHASSGTADVMARLPELPLGADGRARMLAPGDRAGPYRLKRELGVGGMAEVWLADRADGAFVREVALKLPLATRMRRDLAERFVRERDILARLEHPSIARLYDAGVTDDGLPYLAMEYVDGRPITEYCDAGRLPIEARLELFSQVLVAVQFAHANLIIHRDLKPSNILVTGAGQVRLLDFGIAKLIAGDDTAAETQLTQLSGRALTPGYASPEQVRGEPLTIGTDIYSLGVVLFELLAGARPYKLKVPSAAQLEQAILDAEAAQPSDSISAEAAAARSSTVDRVRRTLRGDLDTIVRKALAKQPELRYLTVAEFADDLVRFSSGQVVRARPASLRDRLVKYLRRNRLVVGAATTAALALVAGAAASLWQANVAREQAAVADRQALVAQQESQRATAVQNFLLDLFRANSARQENPIKARSTTARELLDLGAERIESALKDAPEARIEVMKTLAEMYDQLQLYDQEAAIERRRIELIRQVRGPADPELAEALIAHAATLGMTRGREGILPALDEAQHILDGAGDRTSAVRGQLMLGYARRYWVLSADKTKSYADEGVRIMRAHDSQDLASALSLAGRARTRLNEDAEAVPIFRETIGLIEKATPVSYLTLVQNRGFLAETLGKLQRFDEAIAEYRTSVATSKSKLGPAEPSGLFAQSRLARVLHRAGHRAEARQLHEDTVQSLLKLKGPDDTVFVPTARFDYGFSLFAEGRLHEALDHIRAANASTRKHYQGSSILGSWLLVEGRVLAALGRYDEAATTIDEAWGHWTKGLGTGAKPYEHNAFYLARAQLSLARNDAAGAVEWLDRHVEQPQRTPVANEDVQRDVLRSQAHLQRGDLDKALELANRAHSAVAESSARQYFGALESETSAQVARVHLAAGRGEAARPYIERALAWLRVNDAPTSPYLAEAEVLDGRCMLLLGDAPKAGAAARRAAAIHAAQPEVGDHFVLPLRELQRALRNR
jgi:serine/threonine-protein kinase